MLTSCTYENVLAELCRRMKPRLAENDAAVGEWAVAWAAEHAYAGICAARAQEVATTACSSPAQLPPELVPIAKLSDEAAAHALRAAVLSTVSPLSVGPLSFDVWPAEKAELRAAALTPIGELTVPARNFAVAACDVFVQGIGLVVRDKQWKIKVAYELRGLGYGPHTPADTERAPTHLSVAYYLWRQFGKEAAEVRAAAHAQETARVKNEAAAAARESRPYFTLNGADIAEPRELGPSWISVPMGAMMPILFGDFMLQLRAAMCGRPVESLGDPVPDMQVGWTALPPAPVDVQGVAGYIGGRLVRKMLETLAAGKHGGACPAHNKRPQEAKAHAKKQGKKAHAAAAAAAAAAVAPVPVGSAGHPSAAPPPPAALPSQYGASVDSWVQTTFDPDFAKQVAWPLIHILCSCAADVQSEHGAASAGTAMVVARHNGGLLYPSKAYAAFMAKLVLVLRNNMTAGNAALYQTNLLGHLETAITTDEHVKQDWCALVGHVPRLHTLAALNYTARYAARSCISTFLHNVWAPTL
jgi:hypothetical protein